MSDVVVVESPAKAKTIEKYLGRDFTVLASFGHVRDLEEKDGAVLPEQDFAMVWGKDGRGEAQVAKIATALKGAKRLWLATDPDREGEAISWHVKDMLGPAWRAEGQGCPAHHLQRDHQERRAIRGGASARPRCAADRCLSGAPRAGLPGGLHAQPAAVAQAAGLALGRAGAVGRVAADLRARGRDRDFPAARILVASRRSSRRRRARPSRRG